MNTSDNYGLIKVLACAKSGTVGDGDNSRPLYICPCLVGDKTINLYTTEFKESGLYFANPQVKFMQTLDRKGNIVNKAICISRIGEPYKLDSKS